jgi:3-phenylpropionate/cinnamic acid dioxygenase small subunit
MSQASSIDRARLRDLYDDYIALLDACDFDAWLELFLDDSDYRIQSRENFERGLPLATVRCESRKMLADRIDAIRNTQTFAPRNLRRFVSGIRVRRATDAGVEVGASFLVVESLEDEPTRAHMAGSYVDVVTSVDGALKFRSKLAVYDSPIVPISLIYPV